MSPLRAFLPPIHPFLRLHAPPPFRRLTPALFFPPIFPTLLAFFRAQTAPKSQLFGGLPLFLERITLPARRLWLHLRGMAIPPMSTSRDFNHAPPQMPGATIRHVFQPRPRRGSPRPSKSTPDSQPHPSPTLTLKSGEREGIITPNLCEGLLEHSTPYPVQEGGRGNFSASSDARFSARQVAVSRYLRNRLSFRRMGCGGWRFSGVVKY